MGIDIHALQLLRWASSKSNGLGEGASGPLLVSMSGQAQFRNRRILERFQADCKQSARSSSLFYRVIHTLLSFRPG